MDLLIENGILLKPFSAPFDILEGKHIIPDGWTPARTPEMQASFDELKAEASETEVPDFLLWKKAELERGKQLAQFRRPYPGWFPVRPRTDKKIVKAYRALFVQMNPDANKRIRAGKIWSGPKAEYPPDGRYLLRGGTMERAK